MIPTPEEIEAASKPICDLPHCMEEAEWLEINLHTHKKHKMCKGHAIWYSLPPRTMSKEVRL